MDLKGGRWERIITTKLYSDDARNFSFVYLRHGCISKLIFF